MKFIESGNVLNRKTILIINTFIGLLLIIALLFFLRDVISIKVQPKVTGTQTEKKVQNIVKHNFQDYDLIMKKNPFGFQAGELKLLSSQATPSATQADLSLIGTIAGQKDISFAIFLDKTGQQSIYKTGAQVLNIGKLRKVEKDRVILNANSRDIVIPFSDLTEIREIKASAGTSLSSGIGRKTGESAYIIDQQKIQQAIEKPDQIMTDARFIPNMVEGRQQGFVLREVKPGGIYSNLGLQNGDILLRINEFTISNPENALQALTALRGIDRAQLDILRNNGRLTLTYQIR